MESPHSASETAPGGTGGSACRATFSRLLGEQRAAALEQIEAAWQLQVARIEEELSTGWRQHIAHAVDERFQEISARVEEVFAQQLDTRLAELRGSLRSELADRLNQSLRRLRNSQSEAEVHANLLDLSGMFCRRAALLIVDGQAARCEGARDFTTESGGQLGDMETPLASASGLLSAVAAKDTLISECTAAELSLELAGFFSQPPDGRVGLFPVVSHDKTKAVLCAGVGDGNADVAGLELLAMMAGVTLDARAPAQAPALVSISAAPVTASAGTVEPDWSALSATDRDTHSRARRFARVQVAEMRLFKDPAVKEGRARQDLYSALRPEIDAAREAFRVNFVAACPSMVDHLHLELVRTLANDDARLLGPDYPGALGAVTDSL